MVENAVMTVAASVAILVLAHFAASLFSRAAADIQCGIQVCEVRVVEGEQRGRNSR